ncbi:MAG: hypothetical protein HGB04_07960 [Chlorobiaceae bacterium]|nr:hypothetical protein [Chlorobiaceae bacterium]
MRSLPDVTLCCVDTKTPGLGFAALLRSANEIDFGEILFITSDEYVIPEHRLRNLRVVRGNIPSIAEYSTFMIKKLRDLITTQYCLIVQWDGFVIHAESWNDRFLAYDYIGAPWQTREGLVVGNGGFSFRSSKLLDALASDRIVPHHPEDDCICITNRKQLENEWGISFAPADIAGQFSFEFTRHERQFGFHGLSNFPDVLRREELARFVDNMPETLFVNEYFIGFSKKLFEMGDRDLLARLSEKIVAHLELIDSSTYPKKQFSFLVESLVCLGLYRQAFSILSDRRYGAAWNLTYLKIIARRYFGRNRKS